MIDEKLLKFSQDFLINQGVTNAQMYEEQSGKNLDELVAAAIDAWIGKEAKKKPKMWICEDCGEKFIDYIDGDHNADHSIVPYKSE